MILHTVKTHLVNTCIVDEHDRLMVVDVAPGSLRAVLGYIRGVLNRNVRDVDLVLCTHDDFDHIGGVRALAKICGAAMGLPYASRDRIKKIWNDPAGLYIRLGTTVQESFRPRMWRMYFNPARYYRYNRRAIRYPDLRLHRVFQTSPPCIRIRQGDVLPGFENWIAVHTPGHSWDSVCYFHRETRTLISGDVLLGSSRKNRLVLPAIYSNRGQMRKTVRRLKGLNPARVYPGHGTSFDGEWLLHHLDVACQGVDGGV